MVSFDSESIMKNEMILMKVMGLICVVTIMIFFFRVFGSGNKEKEFR